MAAPGEVKWEEWMSTLTPLDSGSPLKTKIKTPEPKAKEATPSASERSELTPDSEKTTPSAIEMATEEGKGGEEVGVVSEKEDVGSEIAK